MVPAEHTVSVWDFFNSEPEIQLNRNPDYDPTLDDPTRREPKSDMGVLLPNPKDVKFWFQLYGRTDEEMNGKFVTRQVAQNPEFVAPIESSEEDPAIISAPTPPSPSPSPLPAVPDLIPITSRSTWYGDIHLVGHEGPVEVCAFSPRLYVRKDASLEKNPVFITVLACAGQDRSLTVWMTNNPRPILIAEQLATKSISDLAWSPDGRTLFATSLDGTINCIAFGDGELGKTAPLEHNDRALAPEYASS